MFDGTPNNRQTAKGESDKIPPPDFKLQKFETLRDYVRKGKVPWRRLSKRMSEQLCNEELVTPEDVGFRNGVAFPLRQNIFASQREYQESLRQRFQHDISNSAVHHLKQTQPQHSAAGTLSFKQKFLLLALTVILGVSLIKYPLITIVTANSFITVYFLLAIMFRLVLLVAGSRAPRKIKPSRTIPAGKLPIITILLPLYRDADSLASLQ